MKQIAIYGAGGFGKEVAMLIEQINQANSEWEIIGFFDDGIGKGEIINNFPILGGIKEVNSWSDHLSLAIGIGSSQIREEIRNKITNPQIKFPALIHPTVLLSDFIKIGEGTIITARCIITVNITIGNFVVLNWLTTIGHDCILENFVSVMPSVNISGGVRLREYVYIGTGAQILNNLEVGTNSIIGAGAVVTKSIPPNKVAFGVPAKVVKDIE